MNTNLPSLTDVEACIAFARNINSKKLVITIEKLRSFPGCEHYSDEEAANVIQSFEQLTAIIFDATTSKQNLCRTDEQVVYLNDNNQPSQIPEPLSKAA